MLSSINHQTAREHSLSTTEGMVQVAHHKSRLASSLWNRLMNLSHFTCLNAFYLPCSLSSALIPAFILWDRVGYSAAIEMNLNKINTSKRTAQFTASYFWCDIEQMLRLYGLVKFMVSECTPNEGLVVLCVLSTFSYFLAEKCREFEGYTHLN